MEGGASRRHWALVRWVRVANDSKHSRVQACKRRRHGVGQHPRSSTHSLFSAKFCRLWRLNGVSPFTYTAWAWLHLPALTRFCQSPNGVASVARIAAAATRIALASRPHLDCPALNGEVPVVGDVVRERKAGQRLISGVDYLLRRRSQGSAREQQEQQERLSNHCCSCTMPGG